MNLQQLEYVLAVDTYRHFALAAEKSFVTQPTLSMMIKKLEDELGVKIFDRSKQPVTPTHEGEEVIRRARKVLAEARNLQEFANELKGEISGELRLGIIPTLAPYLLPLFLKAFTLKHPALKIYIHEMITNEIISKLKSGELDMGLLATPLHEQHITEHPLFEEELFAYASRHEKLPKKKYLLPKEIDLHHLWLLEEGHCLRNQVYNLCELKKMQPETENLHYEAGSIETLINLIDRHEGITIVPYLATTHLKPSQRKNLREFANPKPVREISLVVAENFPRKKLLDHLKKEIVACAQLPKTGKSKSVLEIG
jgi:LysR family transcriptional regulator, hydrogen peroxide-inducible genes activator